MHGLGSYIQPIRALSLYGPNRGLYGLWTLCRDRYVGCQDCQQQLYDCDRSIAYRVINLYASYIYTIRLACCECFITAFRSIGCQNAASTDKQIGGLFESMFVLAWRMNIIRRMRRAICLSVSDPVHRRIISAHPMVLSLSQAYDFRLHRGRGARQASDAS